MIRWSAPARRSLLRQPATVVAMGWIVLAAVAAGLGPVVAPQGPYVANVARRLLPPGVGGLLGTDLLGRDVLVRLVWGSRLTLGMGVLSLALAVGIGLPVGVIAGVSTGALGAALMRLVDALLAFPGLLLAMATVAVLGPGPTTVAIAAGLAAAPVYARVARSATLDIRVQPYVEAARAVGCSRLRIVVRHILPNAAPVLVAFAATQLGWVLLNGAALNFLGLGTAPGTPEWGAMLAEGRGLLRDAPWIGTFPGLALTLTVLAANLLGDGVQELMRAT